MTPSPIAIAADYADAMLTARRARNWIFAGLLIAQLGLFALFCVVHFSKVLDAEVVVPTTATTQPTAVAVVSSTPTSLKAQGLHYCIGSADFAWIVLSLVLAIVLLLIVCIMLVGRLIGVSHVVSAFIWCVILCALLFPWQAFLNNQDLDAVDFKIPGALYNWNELTHQAKFTYEEIKLYSDEPISTAILRWSRFVAYPLLAILITLIVQTKSSAGLRLALGEDTLPDLDATTQERHEEDLDAH